MICGNLYACLPQYAGEVQVEDTAKPGQVNKLSAGDVIRIDKATATTWSSASQGKCKFSL